MLLRENPTLSTASDILQLPNRLHVWQGVLSPMPSKGQEKTWPRMWAKEGKSFLQGCSCIDLLLLQPCCFQT